MATRLTVLSNQSDYNVFHVCVAVSRVTSTDDILPAPALLPR